MPMKCGRRSEASTLDLRRRIYEYFVKNPCELNKRAAHDLGVTEGTISRHATLIRAGWRPQGKNNNG